MARLVMLDAGPLGLITTAVGRPKGDRCRAWAVGLEALGTVFMIPEIADYEVRRELLRIGANGSIRRLDALRDRFRFIPIESDAMLRAAEFWALLRQGGLPTAGPRDLDADAILAGMAARTGGPGDIVTIATSNVAHLGRFPGIDAREWATIT